MMDKNLVTEWKVHQDVTYEDALINGVTWYRTNGDKLEMVSLHAQTVKNFGRIPSFEEALEFISAEEKSVWP